MSAQIFAVKSNEQERKRSGFVADSKEHPDKLTMEFRFGIRGCGYAHPR
jgi:hypothetical protein